MAVAPGRPVSYLVSGSRRKGRVLVYLDAGAVLVSDDGVSTTQRVFPEAALTDLTPPPAPAPVPVPTPTPAGDYVNPTITRVIEGQTFADLDLHEADSGTEYRNCTITGTLSITPSGGGLGAHDLKFTSCTARQWFQRAGQDILFVDTKISGPLVNTQSQLKSYNGYPPNRVEFKRGEISNVSRTPGEHVEGLYVYALTNGWFIDVTMHHCEVMDLNFQSDVADNTGIMGPIRDVLVRGGSYAAPTPTGTNSIYVSQDGSTPPRNVVIDRAGMTVGGSIFIEGGAAANGCKVVN